MILAIQNVITPEQATTLLDSINSLPFVAGTHTAGWHAKGVKYNEQVDHSDPGYTTLNKQVTETLLLNALFRTACRPRRLTPLLFSRYATGMAYGSHLDDPIIANARSDISFTLFLSPPTSYTGGELVIEQSPSEQSYKLDQGDMLVYPSSTLHRVNPVASGTRYVALGWCQSYIRDPGQREILWELDIARRSMFAKDSKSREFDLVSKVHGNLLRMWTDG